MIVSQHEPAALDLRGLTLVVVAAACLAGMVLDSWLLDYGITLPSLALLAGAAVALLLLIPLWRDATGRLAMLILLCLLLGAWRYTVASGIEDAQYISNFIRAGKVEIQGTLSDEPKISGTSLVLAITVSEVSTDQGKTWQQADGPLEVQTLDGQSQPVYGPNYGDTVELQGKLQSPPKDSPVGTPPSMPFPRLVTLHANGNPLMAAFYHLRLTLASVLAQSLPQPEAALLIAILLGLRTPVLKPLTPYFSETGTYHLLVPEGFKVTLLAGLVAASTRWLYATPASGIRLLPAQKRRLAWRRWIATAIVIASIAVYTVLNGAGPSALRGGIMGTIRVIAPRVGRVYNVYTALAMATLIITLINPFVLWDVGFQLSFLGTLGIVLLAPFFQRFLRPLERIPLGYTVAEIMAVTLAALVATLPILALNSWPISLIALVVNVLTVPLLSPLFMLGLLISGTGLIFAPLGIVCGWIAWPLLWYIDKIVPWCAGLPGAYISRNMNVAQAWSYYALLALLTCFLLYRWPHPHDHRATRLISPRIRYALQLSAALLIVLATGTIALRTPPDGRFTIAFLNVGPANAPSQVGPANAPSQGEAIFVRTPDGKTMLIDGGLDAASLAKELDPRLPFWQRLDVVILTSPRSDTLTGLQDAVSRYQIGEVLDAGMLHPTTGYTLWRKTIADRHLNYVPVHQGMTIPVGTSVLVQVLWPPSPLHKSSSEEVDNGLILRIVAPGVSVLLLGASILSHYALAGLLTSVDASYLHADIVQVVAEAGKKIPTELSTLLQMAKPSLVVITPAALSAKQRKAGATSILEPLPTVFTGANWQTIQTAQRGTCEISSTNQGWSSRPEPCWPDTPNQR